jgi:hypothetical protein
MAHGTHVTNQAVPRPAGRGEPPKGCKRLPMSIIRWFPHDDLLEVVRLGTAGEATTVYIQHRTPAAATNRYRFSGWFADALSSSTPSPSASGNRQSAAG